MESPCAGLGFEVEFEYDIVDKHPCLAILMQEHPDQDAPDPATALSTPLSAITIKEEPQAPPSPHATPTTPFAERSLTPEEPAVEAPAPPPPSFTAALAPASPPASTTASPPASTTTSPPPASTTASPPPASTTAPPPRRRRTHAATKAVVARPKAGCFEAPLKEKAAKGEEAALNDAACGSAWTVWRASRGKDPRACVVNKRRVGRKEKFDYYKLFKAKLPKLLYACAKYPKTFRLWVLREGYLRMRSNKGAIVTGRIPSKATLSRAVKKFKSG